MFNNSLALTISPYNRILENSLSKNNNQRSLIIKTKINNAKYSIFLLILFSFFACESNSVQFSPALEKQTDKEIQSLDQKQENLPAYYQKIYYSNEFVRNVRNDAIQDYGYKSKQHLSAEKALEEKDKLNLLRIKKLYKVFGYPKAKDTGKYFVAIPHTILHHVKNHKERLTNWEIIRAGYQIGEIDGNTVAMYLNRTYEYINNGERMRMKGVFKPEQQIDSLLKILKLEL